MKMNTDGDDPPLTLSETPLINDRDFKFPDEVHRLEEQEKREDLKVDVLVEEIVQHLLLREIKDKLFP